MTAGKDPSRNAVAPMRTAAAINAKKAGMPVDPSVLYPTVHDGVRGVAFVEACIASSRRNGAWVKV